MAGNIITITTCESGDWEILQHGEFETSGHSLSNDDWIDLLNALGFEVVKEEISDEEMESLC